MNKDYHEIGLMLDKKHEFVDFVLYCQAKTAVLCVSKSKESRRRRCFYRSFSDDKYREIDLPFHAINITLISSRLIITNEGESTTYGKQRWCSFEIDNPKENAFGDVSQLRSEPNFRRIWVSDFINSDPPRLYCKFAQEIVIQSESRKGIGVQYAIGEFDIFTGKIKLLQNLESPFA